MKININPINMKIENDVLHVISSTGERLVIPFTEKEILKEDSSETFTIDDKWYHTHGYFSREEHQNHIKAHKNGNN